MKQDELITFFGFMDANFTSSLGMEQEPQTELFFVRFMLYMEVFFALRQYVTKEDMLKPGRGILLRPWHLSWYQSAGFRGFVDPVRALQIVAFTNLIAVLGS